MLKLVSKETAQKLKDAGFRLEVRDYYFGEQLVENKVNLDYNDDDTPIFYSAPSIALALKWLREEKEIHVVINPVFGKELKFRWYSVAIKGQPTPHLNSHAHTTFDTAEEAEEDAIVNVLNMKP